MRMAGQIQQHFAMILFLFFLMISFHTVSGSRASIVILHGQDFAANSEASYQENHSVQMFINGRMDLQYTDYSGSEANPRHTPKPPGRF